MASEHLNEEQLLRAAYGAAAAEEERHLATCPRCAGALASFALPAVDPVGSLSGAFWQRQRAAVVARVRSAGILPARGANFWPRKKHETGAGGRPAVHKLAFAAALLLLIAAGIWLLAPRQVPRPAPVQTKSSPIQQRRLPPPSSWAPSDEWLFSAAVETANRIEPRALEPVRLLLPAPRPIARRPRRAADQAVFTAAAGDSGGVFVTEVTALMPAAQSATRKDEP